MDKKSDDIRAMEHSMKQNMGLFSTTIRRRRRPRPQTATAVDTDVSSSNDIASAVEIARARANASDLRRFSGSSCSMETRDPCDRTLKQDVSAEFWNFDWNDKKSDKSGSCSANDTNEDWYRTGGYYYSELWWNARDSTSGSDETNTTSNGAKNNNDNENSHNSGQRGTEMMFEQLTQALVANINDDGTTTEEDNGDFVWAIRCSPDESDDNDEGEGEAKIAAEGSAKKASQARRKAPPIHIANRHTPNSTKATSRSLPMRDHRSNTRSILRWFTKQSSSRPITRRRKSHTISSSSASIMAAVADDREHNIRRNRDEGSNKKGNKKEKKKQSHGSSNHSGQSNDDDVAYRELRNRIRDTYFLDGIL